MPHLDEPTASAPPRFLTLLVEGDALFGTGSRQRAQIDLETVREVAAKHEGGDESARRRATLNTMLALCESQLVHSGGGQVPPLTADTTQVLVFDPDASDFVPLLSVEHLLAFDRIRLLPSKPPSRPSSAMHRSSSRGGTTRASSPPAAATPPRSDSALASSPAEGATTTAATTQPSDTHAVPEAEASVRSIPPADTATRPVSSTGSTAAPADARALVGAMAALLRAAGADPYCLDTELIASAFNNADSAAEDAHDDVASEAVAGGMRSVGDLLVSAFALGRASVGGVPVNPLRDELAASQAQCRGLEAQLIEQAHVLQLLQSALLDARLVIEALVAKQNELSLNASPQRVSISPSEQAVTTTSNTATAAQDSKRQLDQLTLPAHRSLQSGSDDALTDSEATAVAAVQRIAIYFTGRSSKDVPDGSCAVSSALAGKRSRMITLLPGEEITRALLEQEAERAFGSAVVTEVPTGGRPMTPRREALLVGYLRRRDGGVRPHRFRSDASLKAFIARQLQRSAVVPVVQLFPASAFVVSPPSPPPLVITMPQSPTDLLPTNIHVDAAAGANASGGGGEAEETIASPFVRPQSALGLSSDTAVGGGVEPQPQPQEETAMVVRPPRPPSASSTTPQRPPRGSAASLADGAAGGVLHSSSGGQLLGVRSVSVLASKVALDDDAITMAFGEAQEIEGQSSADGMVDVGAVLLYLERNYFNLGDRLRFVRVLPERCQEAALPATSSGDVAASPSRPRSARPVSARRRLEEAALPASRMTFEEFALTMLRVAKS